MIVLSVAVSNVDMSVKTGSDVHPVAVIYASASFLTVIRNKLKHIHTRPILNKKAKKYLLKITIRLFGIWVFYLFIISQCSRQETSILSTGQRPFYFEHCRLLITVILSLMSALR